MSLRPVSTGNSYGQNLGGVNDMIRQLNKEQVTKTFKQAGGSNAVLSGKLPYTTSSGPAYGSLYYDPNGIPAIIIGTTPDGDTAIVIAKPGQNVITAFS